MKYYVLDDYRKKESRTLNKKKLIKCIMILGVIIVTLTIFSIYVANADFRAWIDINIFRKEITENTGAIIEGDMEYDKYIYGYARNIVVLSKNKLENYNSSGKKEFEIDIEITTPLFDTSGKYLCIAEKGGKKLYLISGENIIWQKELENDIYNINVNHNGYVSVSHKTIVKMFDIDGKEITTAYLSSTYAADTAISNDNKELAIAEINYSGSLIQSSVKVISIEKAQTEPQNAVIYTYKAEAKNIILNINYQENNTLICMFDNGIIKKVGETITEEIKFDNDTIFADINLNGYMVEIKKRSTGLFSSEANVEIKQVSSGRINLYNTSILPKEIKTYKNIIALNLGTEIHFIHTNGWLIKKYTSTKDIKDVVICENMAGIVYKDKIELVNL